MIKILQNSVQPSGQAPKTLLCDFALKLTNEILQPNSMFIQFNLIINLSRVNLMSYAYQRSGLRS